MEQIKEREFSCVREGLVIRGREYRMQGQVKGAVLISHGFCQNMSQFFCYASLFAEWGYAAYVFDFCGGCAPPDCSSEGSVLDMTIQTECRDLCEVARYVASLPDLTGKPLFLLGFSQGGLVSALVAGKLQPAGLILLSPALCIPDHARKGKLAGASYDINHVPEVIKGEHMDIGKAYHDDAVPIRVFEEMKQYRGKVLIVHGKQDSVVDYHYAIRAYEAYGAGRCRLRLLSDADHGYEGTQQTVVYAFIQEFLSGKC